MLIVVSFGIAVFYSLGSISYVFERNRVADQYGGRLPRPDRAAMLASLQIQLLYGGAVFGSFLLDGLTLEQVGFSTSMPMPQALAMGIFSYLVLIAFWRFSLAGEDDWSLESGFEFIRSMTPRDKYAKAVSFVAFCVLNPVVEEVVYRGALVYCLGEYLNSYRTAVLISVSLTLLTHLYQGLASLRFHLAFAAMTIVLLFSPAGLVGAIGAHFAGDIVPGIFYRSDIRKWKERRRQRRSKPPATG
jgi:membrane protease YdiL (CAAX protease family)